MFNLYAVFSMKIRHILLDTMNSIQYIGHNITDTCYLVAERAFVHVEDHVEPARHFHAVSHVAKYCCFRGIISCKILWWWWGWKWQLVNFKKKYADLGNKIEKGERGTWDKVLRF